MRYELRILSGQYAGKTWTFEDQEDAFECLTKLAPGTEAKVYFTRWIGGLPSAGGQWLSTLVESAR